MGNVPVRLRITLRDVKRRIITAPMDKDRAAVTEKGARVLTTWRLMVVAGSKGGGSPGGHEIT